MAVQRYEGGCHCGRVHYAVSADIDNTIACNCSRCAKLGVILTFAPAESFVLESGEDALSEYRFNKRVIRHLFCATCGVESFARGTGPGGVEMVAVNVRCLQGVDPDTLNPKRVDGRSA
ncbi:GFA family protein [Labrys wisconsinensis]|uniref:CENP-V/GFA domain-containing protein n=1 Tax=Labrys wisconsinensis TaxID=425677 RepID=A0ABU0IZX8_9HYPH|nr:GFA family protein [Labrys wisconsinensis]MDQ0467574.1 hypothetical protein [Labrys wisconsinensis]